MEQGTSSHALDDSVTGVLSATSWGLTHPRDASHARATTTANGKKGGRAMEANLLRNRRPPFLQGMEFVPQACGLHEFHGLGGALHVAFRFGDELVEPFRGHRLHDRVGACDG